MKVFNQTVSKSAKTPRYKSYIAAAPWNHLVYEIGIQSKWRSNYFIVVWSSNLNLPNILVNGVILGSPGFAAVNGFTVHR